MFRILFPMFKSTANKTNVPCSRVKLNASANVKPQVRIKVVIMCWVPMSVDDLMGDDK